MTSSLDAIGPRLPDVARRALAAWVLQSRTLNASDPSAPAAPVFVTLRLPNGVLRGCIGTLRAVEPDVVRETARNAVLAGTRDPRFPPVTSSELEGLGVEVSVLLPESPVSSPADLDPARYGVVVRDDEGRQGVLLPDVAGVESVEQQLDVARRKAGMAPDGPCRVFRFEVKKFV